MNESSFYKINKESWNKKTEHHYDSEFYDNESFIKGKSSLKSIELDLLGDISGKNVLHLQCHFGQDTISMSRMGAHTLGIDLSNTAIEKAVELNKIVGQSAEFICCNIYDLPQHLNKKFDIVFTSYGVIGWLPDLSRWATLIADYLKKGGMLVFAEFHPVVWMFDDHFNKIDYSYFNKGVILESYEGSYAKKDAPINQEYAMWNHGLAEVIQNLLNVGLRIDSLEEFDYSPYSCFENVVEFEPSKYRIKGLEEKLPMVFALKATKI